MKECEKTLQKSETTTGLGLVLAIETPVYIFSDILFHYFGAMNLQKAAKRLKKDIGFVPLPILEATEQASLGGDIIFPSGEF